MNSSELMINDWYLASEQHSTMDGDYTLEFYPKKLTIDDLIFARNNDWSDTDWREFTKKITLTAEILESNGFELNVKKYPSGYFYQFPQQYEYIVRAGFGVELWKDIFFITDHALMPIRYVHELQHALRLCGLNDLADNFKI